MTTRGVYRRSRVPHARKAASANTSAKRERARACVRKTTGGRVWCWCCCRGHCHCRRRVVVVTAVSTSRRCGARAALPCETPNAVARGCASQDATARDAVAVVTVHSSYRARYIPEAGTKRKRINTEDTAAGLEPAPICINICRPDTTARQEADSS